MNEVTPISPQDAGQISDTNLIVPDIRCAGCIAKIERGLAKVDGVETVRVNFTAKRVAVQHSPALDEDQLTQELNRLGFQSQAEPTNQLHPKDPAKKEAKQLLRALAVAGFGMMNIMLLSISVWAGADGSTRELFHWLSALIALPVIAYAGRPFFASAMQALRHGRTNMDVPISIGVLLATALSIYETITGGQHAYFESAVMLLFFLLAGRALDASMRDRMRAGIGALLGKMGHSAGMVQPDGSIRRVSANELEPGMQILVAAGEALAADGLIEQGHGAIDNSMLTGESTPQPVAQGSQVFAGAINLLDPLYVRITEVSSDTAIAKVARLMDEAGQSRSHYVRIADRASRLYAPAVHSLALLAFVGWMLAGAGWYQSLVIAIAVLIITCPCAIGLAVPAAQVVASNALMKRGLLIKDGSALERLAEVDMALFDKTGTLTIGEPRAEITHLDDWERRIALALAQHSQHPLSRGLANSLLGHGVSPAQLTQIEEKPGQGVFGLFGDIAVGLERPDTDASSLAVKLCIGGASRMIGFDDPLRADAKQTLEELSDMGIPSAILSGDRNLAVEAIKHRLALEGDGELSPAEKMHQLERLKANGNRPLMVGDGLNDGPALASAHASIAPGSASDISQQAADAVFVGEKLMPVALAIKVSRKTMAIVRQNFGLAIGYNMLAVPLALAGLVTPLIAAIAMSLSSLVVVANSLRLARAAR